MDGASPRRALSRRRFLAGVAGGAAALALAPTATLGRSLIGDVTARRSPGSVNNPALDGSVRHIAWVWQFRQDGDRHEIRDTLAANGLGIALKTHDGTRWMADFDDSEDAVSGPAQVEELVAFFENGGVPFHAWYNAHGLEPATEAQMAADVLSAGARSMFIDLESHKGFWRGSAETAEQLGDALRLLQPNAWVSTSIDPRPWEVDKVPLTEFAAFTDEIAPQVYWSDFRTTANVNRFRREGEDPGGIEGVTPAFVLGAAVRKLEPFGLPIHPIGDGSVTADDGWQEFLDESFAASAEAVSVWRFGNIDTDVLQLLRDTPPRPPAYVVQPGDTLGALAATWGTSVDAVATANGIDDPNLLTIGQRLVVPGRGGRVLSAAAPSSPASPAPPAASGSGETYTIEPGDSLWYLAGQWGTTVEAIAAANGITDPGSIRIGDTLVIP